MSDTTFRSVSTEAPAPQVENNWEPNERGNSTEGLVEEPLDSTNQAILDVLGIGDDARTLPSDELTNLNEIDSYVKSILKSKGVTPTKSSVQKTLETLKSEMGLDESADPAIVLDRVGGVVKAWKDLSFITNPAEKRSLFMRLANATSSTEMNRIVYQEMNRKAIWR